MLPITSPHNEQLKALLRLEKRAERDRRRAMAVEGAREVARALRAGLLPLEAWLCPPLVRTPDAVEALEQLLELDAARRCRVYEVPPQLFARLAVREESGGVLAVLPYVTRPLHELPLGAPPFLLVVEGVEKPGNLGAILRSADGAGVDGVIVSAGTTDVHNPNAVRASLGAIFSVPIAEATTPETIDWLRAKRLAIVAASPDGNVDYAQTDLTRPLALVLGAEDCGLSPHWRGAGLDTVRIPMAGMVDSLNLSASAAILLYEGVRQRRALGLLPAPPGP